MYWFFIPTGICTLFWLRGVYKFNKAVEEADGISELEDNVAKLILGIAFVCGFIPFINYALAIGYTYKYIKGKFTDESTQVDFKQDSDS